MRSPSAVLKKLGAWLKMTGFLIPEVGLAGTVPCGLSAWVAPFSGAKARGQSLTPSKNSLLVFFLIKKSVPD
jgi:hypothetical protein